MQLFVWVADCCTSFFAELFRAFSLFLSSWDWLLACWLAGWPCIRLMHMICANERTKSYFCITGSTLSRLREFFFCFGWLYMAKPALLGCYASLAAWWGEIWLRGGRRMKNGREIEKGGGTDTVCRYVSRFIWKFICLQISLSWVTGQRWTGWAAPPC